MFKQQRKNMRIGLVLFAFVLFAVACWMRWHTLDVPFDRDSYDEGVYWQSLRALAQGHALYGQIFYAQPPAFLLSIYPAYLIFGQSILAARMGNALLSLCGLPGAFFVGKVLRGNAGALVAVLLLIVNPLYLMESQTLQADAPSAALMLLALGLAYLWWKHPGGWIGYALAVLAGVFLALSILSKLFGLADLVPIGLLMLAHLWRIRQLSAEKRLVASGSLLALGGAWLLTCLCFLLPFSGSFSSLWDQVITFHTAARASTGQGQVLSVQWGSNLYMLWQALTTPLGAFALYGTLVSLIRRDWRVLPLIAWFFAVFCLLLQQLPLFQHHLVTLVPPLVLLATMGLGPLPIVRVSSRLRLYLLRCPLTLQYPLTDRRNEENTTSLPNAPDVDDSSRIMPNRSRSHRTGASGQGPDRGRTGASPIRPYPTAVPTSPYGPDGFALGNSIVLIVLCMIIVYFLPILGSTYQGVQLRASDTDTQMSAQVARDLDTVTRPDQWVITDAQFLVAEGNRSTPPQLVDTSFVRIKSGYLSNAQLIQISKQTNVHTVLFYTGRLSQMQAFYLWVSQHFQKVRDYGGGRELWVKME